ncbi:MAG: hypothetical protein AB7G87_14480 [Clostridia bacterium]
MRTETSINVREGDHVIIQEKNATFRRDRNADASRNLSYYITRGTVKGIYPHFFNIVNEKGIKESVNLRDVFTKKIEIIVN